MEDLTGKKFNKLTVLEFSHKKGNKLYWKCQCDCGNIVLCRSDGIKNGHAKSCGCLKTERLKTNPIHYIHGKRHTRLYEIWSGIISRCENNKMNNYSIYGGRGITMCEEWRNSFQAFYDWAMANGYRNDLTIDRINNNGNYEPNNCRWATKKEQANNTRRNKIYIINGEKLNIGQISEKYNIEYKLLWSRLNKGFDIENAISPKKWIKR